ncbi:Ring-infected erythrocyte surface antigen like [Actinidia chinensis var. chinensis]|uniref:Ring-infected erythrocyte surface antigen like n=1 Tax=Actinidia chinensis var. chinensis TaxID=1590841 RepID=A0A2R6QFQ8_ACTCC|nr:Ring-infected erythrocyte surface antigen like [Actinidia chinensis var. chinensis]
MKDVDEPQGSDHMDPLYGLSGLSLFPRTIRVSTDAPKPNHTKDIESIHNFMKSTMLRSPSKHSEQAKAVLDGNSELLNSKFASFIASEKKIEDVAKRGKENAQERRPGLGRRRARFSLKPNSSQPYVRVGSSLDIEELEDPVEYFLAHERLENAQKELQRQMGGNTTNLNDYNMYRTERRRRPALLERSVRYKHRYSSMLPESDETFMSSQVPREQDNFRSPGCISQPETADSDVELQEKELAGSMSKTENRVNELLDELLSNNSENLDGDELLSFLQDRLHIKPLDLDKLCLPDFHDVGKNDFMDLEDNLPRPRNALSDIHNLMKGISGKTPVKQKQVAESPVHSLASPTPPKSPFASITLLQKHLLHSDLLNDPFSPFNLSPARNSCYVEPVNEQSDHYNTRKKSGGFGELKSLITEIGDIRVNDVGSQEMITGDSVIRFENSANDNSSRYGVGINDMPSGSHVDLIENNVSRNTEAEIVDGHDSRLKTDMMDVCTNCPNEMITGDSITQFEKSAIDNSSRHGVGINDMSSGSHGDLIDNNASRNMGVGIVNDNGSRLNTDTDVPTSCPNEMEENDSRFKTDTDVPTSCPNEMEENDSRFKTDTDVHTSCPNEMDENDNRLITDVQANGPNEMEENVGDMLHEAVSSEDLNFGNSSRPCNDFQTDRRNEMENNVNQIDEPNEMEQNVENMPLNAQPDINIEHPTTGKLNDQSSPAAVGPHAMDGPSETSDVIPEHHIENVQEPSGVSLNERSSEKRPPRAVHKRKTLSHRQSLAGAGTDWESGVRRSKRIRMRPLEYWRGERFLYGRIHESLTTVIGVKYVSPAKGDEGKPSIRVKSYVSDEYKDLVELAALH